jgi:hypothetical protein
LNINDFNVFIELTKNLYGEEIYDEIKIKNENIYNERIKVDGKWIPIRHSIVIEYNKYCLCIILQNSKIYCFCLNLFKPICERVLEEIAQEKNSQIGNVFMVKRKLVHHMDIQELIRYACCIDEIDSTNLIIKEDFSIGYIDPNSLKQVNKRFIVKLEDMLLIHSIRKYMWVV